MPYSLDDKLVVGISSRALFDLEAENMIFEEQGVEAYTRYQIEHENDILQPGTAFPLVKALHNLKANGNDMTEIIIMSRNSPETCLRIFKSIEYYGLNISRAALVSGAAITPYLEPLKVDLFLSPQEEDIQDAINANIAAAIICRQPEEIDPDKEISQIRIAFDGDAVIFSDEAEKIYQAEGLEAFAIHERELAGTPLQAGPFAKLLKTISTLQMAFPAGKVPIRTALVTARNTPAHERAIRTLRAWNVHVDEAFFLGGVEKTQILRAFGAHIFFDDQEIHTEPASKVVPAARVPYKDDLK
ncbi:MAG: 5'-nucleotidase [Lachnospiraceae bacterium]|nr:5'-nucleotidase [Lachnospiraceae bacterium]